jgi:RNA polymerase sigma-70 factor (ECF subfamily)
MSDFAQALELQIPRLRRYARALTRNPAWADDLVQDTLERALSRRWLYRLNSNFAAWLLTIMHRVYLNDARRQHALPEPAGTAAEPAQHEDFALRIDLQRALARLNDEHRAVILLVALEQLSYKEAAAVLNLPLGTVMSRLARAREELREALATPAAGAAAGAHLTRIK